MTLALYLQRCVKCLNINLERRNVSLSFFSNGDRGGGEKGFSLLPFETCLVATKSGPLNEEVVVDEAWWRRKARERQDRAQKMKAGPVYAAVRL
jgi:hypothetical protein